MSLYNPLAPPYLLALSIHSVLIGLPIRICLIHMNNKTGTHGGISPQIGSQHQFVQFKS